MSFDLNVQPSNEYGQISITWDSLGNFNLIRGQNKLQQDILKLLGTDINPLDANFATQLNEIVGSALGKNQTVVKITDTITNAINYLKNLQESQSKIQQVDALEIIQEILEINVDYLFDLTHNNNDVGTYKVQIVVANAAGQKIMASRNINAI